ncbi:MAG: efflux RND transporter periplasmic adaptor subunit [Halieaceae bacterium]|nr:efflux RND transporter periplasmic adaptor subunit [Halieaceae bacterium]
MKINLLTAGITTAAAVTATYLLTQQLEAGASAEPTPSYWVAPMDPSYRRDAPGKSPMGMDLVPVYEESAANTTFPAISASVQQSLGVKIAKAKQTPVRDIIKGFGLVEFDQSFNWNETVHLEAWVNSVKVTDIGQYIQAGDVLYTLYSHELINAQENLILALNQNNKPLYGAAKQRLLQFDVGSSTIAQIEQRKQVLSEVPILAKRTGIAATLSVSAGQFVKSGQTLLTVQNPSKRWITAELYASKAPTPLSHYQAYVLGKNGTKTEIAADSFHALPTVDVRSRKPLVRIAVDNTQLRVGEFVELELRSNHTRDIVTVPSSAIVSNGNVRLVAQWLGEGVYRFVEVELGETYQNEIEVISGIAVNDNVIINGQFLLDSESLLTAEAARSQLDAQPDSVWVMAEIISATPDFGIVEAHHGPIPEWSWPAMTMSFEVLDSALWTHLKQGQSVHMRITATEFGYGIAEIMIHGDSTSEHRGHTAPKSSTDAATASIRHNHSHHNAFIHPHGDHHD